MDEVPFVPSSWIRDALLLSGSRCTRDGRNWQCPAHRDSEPSLAVNQGRSGAVVHCLAGCTVAEVLGALGLGMRHLYAAPNMAPKQWLRIADVSLTYPPLVLRRHPSEAGYRLESIHDYRPDVRLLRYRHPVSRDKSMQWERQSRGVWVPGLGTVRMTDLPLYRAAEARMAVAAGERLVLVESESSVDAICARGVYATTWAGGAGTVQLHRISALRGYRGVMVCPDNDPAGLAALEQIRSVLGADVPVLLPGPGEDARDLLRREGISPFRLDSS